MRPDQERVRNLLLDTVTLLCKNGLDYKKEMKVQGLIGITLDDDDVFLVHFDELSEIPSVAQDEELESEKHGTKRPGDVIDIDLSPAKRPHHAGPGGSTPRRLDLSNTLRQQVPETKPRIKQEVGDDVVILDNDEPEDQKPGLPIEGNIEMDSNQLAALTGFRDGGGGAPPGPGQMGMPGGQGWSPGRVGPPGMPPHGSNQDMISSPYLTNLHQPMMMPFQRLRKPSSATNKPYKCQFPGCGKSYFHSNHLRAHETQKHGRQPKFRRQGPSSWMAPAQNMMGGATNEGNYNRKLASETPPQEGAGGEGEGGSGGDEGNGGMDAAWDNSQPLDLNHDTANDEDDDDDNDDDDCAE